MITNQQDLTAMVDAAAAQRPAELGPDGKEWSKTAAGYAHVEAMVPRADGQCFGPYWYGWALRGAFVAGAEWQERRQQPAPSAVPADPMDWSLPCAVTVGHGTMGKGVSLRTLVTRMKLLYEMATGSNADEVANRTLEHRTALADAFRAKVDAFLAQQPSPTPPAEVQPAPVLDYPPLPEPDLRRGGFPNLFREDQMRAYVDADRAARAPADSQPAPVRDEREAFEAWIKNDCGDLSTFGSGKNIHYHNSAVNNAWSGWRARAVRAPADSVTAPAGGVAASLTETVPFANRSTATPLEKARIYLKAMGDQSANNAYFFDDGYPRIESSRDALATLAVLEQLAADPTPPAQAADSVLEDAALMDWLRENTCDLRCIGIPTGGDDYEVNWIVIEHHMAKPNEREIGRGYTDDPRDAIRAARKQAGAA